MTKEIIMLCWVSVYLNICVLAIQLSFLGLHWWIYDRGFKNESAVLILAAVCFWAPGNAICL